MKSNAFKKYLIVVILPLLILLSMTVKPLTTYYQGQEILIKTKPYDPRDVFRGDHVNLNYEISEISTDKLPEEFKDINATYKLRNKKLYVILKKQDKYYTVDHVVFEKPKDKLYLTCKYQYTNFNEGINGTEKNSSINGISVSYNLDRYFVPENTGHKLEDLSRKGQLTARIKVWKGYSYLIDIF